MKDRSTSRQNKIAFTLAEVLITLGIIGVVAALTIPNLVNNYQKQEYVNQLKKAYTQFNQALSQVASDNDCAGDLKCTGFFDTSSTNIQALGDEIVKHFKVIKNCELAISQGCLPIKMNINYDGSNVIDYNLDDGDKYGDERPWGYRFIVADGASFLIQSNHNNCLTRGESGMSGQMTSQTCGDMYIDVNGPQKGPNFWGRDVHRFYITNGKGPMLCPLGLDGWSGGWWQTGGCGFGGAKDGEHCSGRIIEEGWKMNY